MSVIIPPPAEQLITRLARLAAAYDAPRRDEGAVERAIHEHLRRLGVEGMTVRFVTDVPTSRWEAVEAALAADTWVTPWRQAWREARHEAWSAAPWRVVRRLAEVSARRVLVTPAWRPVRELLAVDVTDERYRWGTVAVLEWVGDLALFDAFEAAVEVATWSAEPDASPPIARWIEILSPLVDALEAGLWLCWMTPGEARAVLRPAARFVNRRLHRWDGPAVAWPDGPSDYFWRGVRVPERVVLRPLELTPQKIADEHDEEVRRVMLERSGAERFDPPSSHAQPMTTVLDTFARLERQCLGLDMPCVHGSDPRQCADARWRSTEAVEHIQYEITGPGGGVWHLVVGLDDCELREGRSTDTCPLIVRTSSEDWLMLWDGTVPASVLIESGRMSIERNESDRSTANDLPFLGALGPLRELDSTRWPTSTPPYTQAVGDSFYPCVLRDSYPHALENVYIPRIPRRQLPALEAAWGGELDPARTLAARRWLGCLLTRITHANWRTIENVNRTTVELASWEKARLISRARLNPRFFRFLADAGCIAPASRGQAW